MGLVQKMAAEKAKETRSDKYQDPSITVLSKHVRCPYCDRLLCEGEIDTIRVKCPSCKQFSTIKQL